MLRTLAVIYLITICLAANQQSDVIGPLSPVTSQKLFTLQNTSPNSELVISPKLESLQLDQTTSQATPQTEIRMNVFNRSVPGNLNTYILTQPGVWSFVLSSARSLSCSLLLSQRLVNNTQNQTLALLSFNRDTGELNVEGESAFGQITQNITLTFDQIRRTVRLGENCSNGGLLLINNYQILRAGQNWTTLRAVAVPDGWYPQAVSDDLIYIVSQQKLYKFDDLMNAYEQVYSLPQSSSYLIRNYQNRIIVTLNELASNVSDQVFLTNALNLTVLVFNGEGNTTDTANITNTTNTSSIRLIGQFQSARSTQQELIRVLISPLLTKVAIVTSSNPNASNIVAKHIDYSQNQILDLKFEQPNRFIQTLDTSNLQTELDFNDYYIVVRNGSSYKSVQSGGNPFQNQTFPINNTIIPSNTSYINASNASNASNANQSQAELIPATSGGKSQFHPNCLILPTNINLPNISDNTCFSYPLVQGSVRFLPVEEVYQFVGTNVALVNTRNLLYSVANRELTSFVKTFIDTSFNDLGIVINEYKTSNTTFDFDEFNYGNYLSNSRVQAFNGNIRRTLKPVAPIISFTEPNHDQVFSSEHLLQWIYALSQNNTNMTNLSVFTFDNTTANRYRENNLTMDPFLNVLYQSERYLLLQSTDAIKLFTYNTLQKRYIESADLASLINNMNAELPSNVLYLNATESGVALNFTNIKNVTNTSQTNSSIINTITTNTTNLNTSTTILPKINTTIDAWLVSSDGNRIAAGNRLFVREAGSNFKQVMINDTNVTIASFDSSLSYLLTNIGTLYLMDFQDNRVIPLNSRGIVFPPGSIVNGSYNRVVVHAYNGSSLWIKAFQIDDEFNLNQCFDYVLPTTVNAARVYLSPFLTKIVVLKQRNQVSNLDCYNPSNPTIPANNTPVVPPANNTPTNNTPIVPPPVVPPPVVPPSNDTGPSNFTPPFNFLPPLNNTPILPPANFTPTVIPPTNSSNATRRLTSEPLIQPSEESNSTNSLILCNNTSVQAEQQLLTAVEAYCINYGANSFEQIPIISNAIVDPNALFVDLSENMLLIRQISSTSNQTTNQTVNPLQEFIYYFSQNVVLLPVISRSVVSYPNSVWQRALLLQRRGRLYLMCEYVQAVNNQTTRFVTSQEFSANQAQFNYQRPFLKTEIVSGLIKICPIGCTDCLCTSCLPGYALDNYSISCRPCPENCQTCQIGYPSVCSLCWSGAYLTAGGTCQLCDKSCLTCNGSATQCTTCYPGYYYDPVQQNCASCPFNCFRCTDNMTCQVCRQGFVLSSTNQTALCISCALTCTSCNPANITECTACALGLQLVHGKCVKCPQNCLKCNGIKCGLCVQGYSFNKYGTCILKCELPCITCVDNQPTVCLSCQYGSTLVGGTCQLQTNFTNLTSQGYADTCGVGLNYYLYPNNNNVSTCEQCPKINNCIQCDYLNTYHCAVCSPGYYIDSYSYCSACQDNCTTCVSAGICLTCKPGFTILANYKEGVCLECEWPCATCLGTTTYCTSCESGYIMKGWRCVNINTVTLIFTLASNTNNTDILSQINQITQGLVYLLNLNNTNITGQDIIVTEVMGDKVVLDYTPPNYQTLPLNLTNNLVNTIPGTDFNVTDVVVAANATARRLAENSPLLVSLQTSQGVVMTVNVTIVLALLLVAFGIIMLRRRMHAKKMTRASAAVVEQQKSVLDETVQKQSSGLLVQ